MTIRRTVARLSAAALLFGAVGAQSDTTRKSARDMSCAMKPEMSAMQKDMRSMMTEMNARRDPALKPWLQKMHAQMGIMMGQRWNMASGMMGGEMMQDGPRVERGTSAIPPATADDHPSHHSQE